MRHFVGKWLVNFSAGNAQVFSHGRSSNCGPINVKMGGSGLDEKSILGLCFSLILDWGFYVVTSA